MIRSAERTDAAAITAIERASFGIDTWSRTLVELELAAPGRVVLVAVEGELTTGYASAAVVADVADLTRIAVVPDARRAGVGGALLAALLDAASDRGAARMMLEVDETNRPALTLYASAGFVEISRRDGYYGPGVDAVVMELAPIHPRDSLVP